MINYTEFIVLIPTIVRGSLHGERSERRVQADLLPPPLPLLLDSWRASMGVGESARERHSSALDTRNDVIILADPAVVSKSRVARDDLVR